MIVSRYRRILSCAFVRAIESCLLAGRRHMDAGAREAEDRRRTSMREEEMDRREEAAFLMAHMRGSGGKRRGGLPF